MDQARLNSLNAKGLGRAAAHLGAPFAVHRPTDSNDPIEAAPIATLMLAYTQEAELKFTRSLKAGVSNVDLLCDTTNIAAGDYLVGAETLFVARVDPFRPASAVLCNNVLSVLLAAASPQAGTNSYGGFTDDGTAIIAQRWPASLLLKSRTQVDPTKLPSDMRSAYYSVLLPNIPGVVLKAGMRLQDIRDNIYLIESTQLSNFGWLVSAALQIN